MRLGGFVGGVQSDQEGGEENEEGLPLRRLGEVVVLDVVEGLIVTASGRGEDGGEGKSFEAGACVPLPVDLDCDEADKDSNDDLRRGARSEEDQHAREHEAPCALEDFEPKGVALVLQVSEQQAQQGMFQVSATPHKQQSGLDVALTWGHQKVQLVRFHGFLRIFLCPGGLPQE